MNIESVVIGESVKIIHEKTFWRCQHLSTVVFPQSLVEIGVLAFSETSLSKVTLPNTVTTLHSQCFFACQITSIVIPLSAKYVESYAFSQCTELILVTLNSCGTWVSPSAFHASNPLVECISNTESVRTTPSRHVTHIYGLIYPIYFDWMHSSR